MSQPKKIVFVVVVVFVVIVVIVLVDTFDIVVFVVIGPRNLALKFSQNLVPNSGYILVVVVVAVDVVIGLIIFSKKRIFEVWSKLGQ